MAINTTAAPWPRIDHTRLDDEMQDKEVSKLIARHLSPVVRTWATGAVYVDAVKIGYLTLEGCKGLDQDCGLPGWRLVFDREKAERLDVAELWANMEGRDRP